MFKVMDCSLKMNSRNNLEMARFHFVVLEEFINDTKTFLKENLNNQPTDKVSLGLYAVHVKSKSLFLSKLHPKLKTIVEVFCEQMPSYAWSDRNSYDRQYYERMIRCLLSLEESMCLLEVAVVSLDFKKEESSEGCSDEVPKNIPKNIQN